MEKQILSKLKTAFETRNFNVAEELCLQELEKNTKQNIKSIYGQTTAQSLRVEKEILKSKTAVTKSKINRVSVCAIQPVSTGILVHPFYGGKDVCAHEIAQEAHLQGFDYAILPNPLKETWLEPGAYNLGQGRSVPVLANRLAGDGFAKDLQHHAKAKKRGNPKRWSDGVELLKELQQEHRWTVIHTHYPHNIRVTQGIKEACPETPIVATLHNGRILYDYEIYDKLVFLTEKAKQAALAEFPEFEEKCVIISPDVRAEFMQPRHSSTKREGLLFVSTMREGAPERKGLDLLLQALSLSKELKNVPLVIVGDGPDRKKYETSAIELGVNAQFKGALTPNEIITEIDKASWFVMPSRHEPFGIVYLEAAVRGVPIIGASDAVTEIELRTGSKVGVAFDANATDAVSRLCTLLLDALSNKTPVDTSESGRIAMAQQIQRFFGHGKMAKAYCDLFKNLSCHQTTIISPISPENKMIDGLIASLPVASKTILIQFSNSDAGLNAIKGVVDEIRKSYPQYYLVGVDMSDLIGNTPNPTLNKNIFDYTITLSEFTGPRDRSKLDKIRENTAHILSKLFEQWTPIVSMVSNDRRWIEEEMVVQLRFACIPVALLQESIRRDQAFPSFNETHEAHGRGGCDLILAWGEQSIQYFKEVGVPEERIKVVGSPRLDVLTRSVKAIDKNIVKSKLEIDSNIPCVLMTTSPMANITSLTPKQFYDSIQNTFEIVRKINESGKKRILLFRHHRSEYKQMEKFGIFKAIEANPYIIYSNEPSLEECLAITDALINYSSTTAIEAGLVGIPVGILNTTNTDYGIDYVEKGIASLLSNWGEVEGFIATTGNHSPPEKNKLNFYVACTGRAEAQVADSLVHLAQTRNNKSENSLNLSEIRSHLENAKLRLVEDPATDGNWKIVFESVSEVVLPKIYKYITDLAVERYERALEFIESQPLVDSYVFDEWPELTSIIKRDKFEPSFHFYWHATLLREISKCNSNEISVECQVDSNTLHRLQCILDNKPAVKNKGNNNATRAIFKIDWQDISPLKIEVKPDYIFYTDEYGHAIKRYKGRPEKLKNEGYEVVYVSRGFNADAKLEKNLIHTELTKLPVIALDKFIDDKIIKKCDLLAKSVYAELLFLKDNTWSNLQHEEFHFLVEYILRKLRPAPLSKAFQLKYGFIALSKAVGAAKWIHQEPIVRHQPMVFTLAGHKCGSEVVSIAPHLYTRSRFTNRVNKLVDKNKYCYLPHIYEVHDGFSKKALLDMGVQSESIKVTEPVVFKKSKKSSASENTILVLLQNDYAQKHLIESVVEATSNINNVKILLKEHPRIPLSEKAVEYLNTLILNIERLSSSIPLEDAISEAKVVITVYSSAGVQAEKQGVDVVWVVYNNLDSLLYLDLIDGFRNVNWSYTAFKQTICRYLGEC